MYPTKKYIILSGFDSNSNCVELCWMMLKGALKNMGIINSVYYVFYTSFASVSLLSTLGLVGDVGDSLTEKLRVIDFVYLLGPIMFYMIHIGLKKKTYYQFVAKVENGKKMFASTLLAGIIILSFKMFKFLIYYKYGKGRIWI